MPFDSDPSREFQTVPLARLAPDGGWQTELAHSRCQHLLIWITRGQGRIFLNGEQRGFGLHSVVFIPAGTLWSAEFSRQCLGQVLMMSGPLLPPFPEQPVHKRFTSLQEQTRLAGHFEAISREQAAREPYWHHAVQARCELAAIALQRQPGTAAQPPGQPAARRLCRAYCQRLAGLQGGQATMAAHAEALKVTPTHLTRVCKAAVGKTAAALLTERQLHAARTLLITSDLPVRDIAARLGFGSAAYFTRFISQHTGKPPSKLRETARSRSQ
ncbi:helix-turn-helix transcriptional regulator [Leisingera daeponensis]|uniref:helix-turn-helix transcriptional regulator n=1 Tax=Leisingera daeponensis TaxID=405746 RepID=UPI001C94ACD4|nr:helix-turn-helix domain-containing protein [Leisingera daeponensis]MBY6055162.1 AraC family transcriptional regulator [Leisingera daeponensis]